MQSTAILLPTTTDDPFHAFESLNLDPARFTHRLHLTFAWRYLQRDGFPEGAVRFARQLKAYVEHVGAASKYHETITWAYLALLNEERILGAGSDVDFEEVLRRRPDLLDHRGGAIARCYSPAQLQHPDASRVFMLPRIESRL